MKFILSPLLGAAIAQLYLSEQYLIALAVTFIAGLWCAWPQQSTADRAVQELMEDWRRR